MDNINYSKTQMTALVGLRLLIGWHFLYEGIVKLLNPNWSAKGYLLGADGFFEKFFHWLGGSDALSGMLDFFTIWAMIFIGITLIFGFLVKPAAIIGMVLLGMFYLAYPPFPGNASGGPTEGSYLIVNKNLIELFALMVVMAFPTAQSYGIERFFAKSPSPSTAN